MNATHIKENIYWDLAYTFRGKFIILMAGCMTGNRHGVGEITENDILIYKQSCVGLE